MIASSWATSQSVPFSEYTFFSCARCCTSWKIFRVLSHFPFWRLRRLRRRHSPSNGERRSETPFARKAGWGGEQLGIFFWPLSLLPRVHSTWNLMWLFFACVCSSCFGLGMSGFGFFRGRGNLHSCSFLLRSPRRNFFLLFQHWTSNRAGKKPSIIKARSHTLVSQLFQPGGGRMLIRSHESLFCRRENYSRRRQ